GVVASATLWRRGFGADFPTSAPAPRAVAFPEKTELILLTDRPPQLETPIKYFRQDITLFLAALALPLDAAAARAVPLDVPRHQQCRPKPGAVAVESQRVSTQC